MGIVRSIMTDLLNEAVDDDSLYHATDYESAARILHSDTIIGHAVGRSKVDQVSLTRSKHFARDWKDGNCVILQFSKRSIANNHKISPFDYFNGHPFWGQHMDEQEEAVAGNLKHVSKHLKAILVPKHIHKQMQNDLEKLAPEYHESSFAHVILTHPKMKVIL